MYRSKYRNKKIVTDLGKFDSKGEYKRYQELLALEKKGDIQNLKRQVSFLLIPSQRDEAGKCIERPCSYKADFVYEVNGETVVEDFKGMRTPEYVIKRKLMLKEYGIRIMEVE